jgi:hypothetical protein
MLTLRDISVLRALDNTERNFSEVLDGIVISDSGYHIVPVLITLCKQGYAEKRTEKCKIFDNMKNSYYKITFKGLWAVHSFEDWRNS